MKLAPWPANICAQSAPMNGEPGSYQRSPTFSPDWQPTEKTSVPAKLLAGLSLISSAKTRFSGSVGLPLG